MFSQGQGYRAFAPPVSDIFIGPIWYLQPTSSVPSASLPTLPLVITVASAFKRLYIARPSLPRGPENANMHIPGAGALGAREFSYIHIGSNANT